MKNRLMWWALSLVIVAIGVLLVAEQFSFGFLMFPFAVVIWRHIDLSYAKFEASAIDKIRQLNSEITSLTKTFSNPEEK